MEPRTKESRSSESETVCAWTLQSTWATTRRTRTSSVSIGLAASHTLNTTVMPFILRGVSLLGIDSVNCPMAVRAEVWRRLATDMKPPGLKDATATVPFAELPKAFDDFIGSKIVGRVVVDLNA